MPFAVYDTKIGPMYVGNTEIVKAYLGNTLVYSKLPYPYSTTDIIDGLGGWNGNYTDLGNDKASVTLDNGNTITIIPSKTYVIFHDPIVDAYFKERLGVTSGEITLAQFRTLDASTAAFTSAHRPEDYAEVTEFNEYRFLSGTTIPGGGFGSCSAMEEIRIPVSVTTINGNPGAFNACSSLTTIDLNDTVATLYLYAFLNCTSLESVTGCGNLTTIEAQSFRYCSSLKSLDDWSHIKKINNYAFRDGCDLRGEISLPLIEYIGQNVFAYGNKLLTKVTFGPNLTHFEGSNFISCTGLEEVDFNGAVLTSIPSSTFYNCTSLTKVIPPTGVTTIDTSAFENCHLLEQLQTSPISSLGNSSFRCCEALQTVNLSNTITTIPQCCFYNDSNGTANTTIKGSLTFSSLPTSITTIQTRAFRSNPVCDDVYLPNLTSIDTGAFLTTGIKRITSLGSITSMPGGTNIGCFQNCTSLVSAVLPTTLTSLGLGSFRGCSALQTITGLDNVISMGNLTFYQCSSLISISLPSWVNSSANTYMFQGCSSLVSINAPSLEKTGTFTFDGCTSLETLSLPSITSISASSVRGMTSLKTVDLGPNLTEILNYAFYQDTSLQYVILRATTPPSLSYTRAFNSTNNCKFYVPYSSDHSVLAAYQSATNWSTYASRMLELDENGDIPS